VLFLYAFGDDVGSKVDGHASDGTHEHPACFVLYNVDDDGVVDLQGIEREPVQVAETGIAGAKIVDG
jgi:hypothetical protein